MSPRGCEVRVGPRDEVRSCEDGWLAQPVRANEAQADRSWEPLEFSQARYYQLILTHLPLFEFMYRDHVRYF